MRPVDTGFVNSCREMIHEVRFAAGPPDPGRPCRGLPRMAPDPLAGPRKPAAGAARLDPYNGPMGCHRVSLIDTGHAARRRQTTRDRIRPLP